MQVWIVKDGENLPIEPGARKMRAGLLTDELIRRGHTVTWWTSTFSHARKTLLFPQDRTVEISPTLRLRLLHAGSYRRNVSLGRYFHNKRLGARLREAAAHEPAPDLVIAAFPIIDFADAAVAYAKERGIPAIVDVRDLWPDTFLDFFPRFLHPIARVALWNDYRKTHRLLRDANALAAISRGCLDWGKRRGKRPDSERDRVFHVGYPEAPPTAPAASPEIERLLEDLRQKTVVTYVGSFGRSYDLGTIVRAARRLWETGRKDIHFVLAGDGEQLSTLRSQIHGLGNVSTPGWVDHAGILRILRASHAGIVPGPNVPDAMPNKVFEYLSEGLPLLSCIEGELRDTIQEEGIGVQYAKGNERDFIAAVENLASDRELLGAMSDRARACFAKRFRAEEIYRDYADFAETLVTASRTAAAM